MNLPPNERLRIFDFLPKAEIHERVRALRATNYQVIPLYLFCELAEMHLRSFQNVFMYKTREMTNNEQKRLSRAFNLLENGEVRAIKYPYKVRGELQFSKEPKQRLGRGLSLAYKEGEGFKLNAGIYNKQSFRRTPLLDNKNGK